MVEKKKRVSEEAYDHELCSNLFLPPFQRVLQRAREGQGSRRLPEAEGEAAAGGGPEGLPGLDHTGRGHRPRERGGGDGGGQTQQ